MNSPIERLIKVKGEIVYLEVELLTLCSHVRKFNNEIIHDLNKMNNNYMGLFNAIWKLSVIMDKIAYTYSRAILEKGNVFRWSNYARTDIELFHIILRSSMDYVTKIISCFLPLNKTSFSIFRKDLNDHKDVVGKEIYELVSKADWYEEFNRIRNELIHGGSEITVYHQFEVGTCFSIGKFSSGDSEILVFEKYAVKYFSLYIDFLDQVGHALRRMIVLDTPIAPLKLSGQGLRVFRHWSMVGGNA